MPQIRVRSLTKNFSVRRHTRDTNSFLARVRGVLFPPLVTKKAVEDISFDITQGELVGFIGPNGAGKTTTLKMLSGLLYPTSGSARVLGYEPFRRDHDFLRQIALVMGQKQQLWWDLPVLDSLMLNKVIYDIPQHTFDKSVRELGEIFAVSDLIHLPPRTMSLGQRMKCELIASLIHRPRVLFLDEPTIGLDVVMQQHLRDFVAEYNRKYEATVLLTSHYMDDVRKLCKRVIVIHSGSLLFDGNLDDLVRRHVDYKVLTLVFAQPVPQSYLSQFGSLESYNNTSATLQIKSSGVQAVIAKMMGDFVVEDITIKEPDVEDVIREIFTS